MSLNGLDDPKIVEAHEAGIAEPGGWFLLKYSSRDEVELLDKGNGGIVEIRNAIAGFEEESPLYGFLRYRRRNVIVKYLPEDCSRLIQARVAVHFNAVCERFSPYDTIFEISTAAELRDTKLSAACSLHAASGSTASSTSSRRRRLVEIAEEEEEDQRSSKRQSVLESDDGRPRTPGGQSTAGDEVKLNSELASSPEHSKFAGSTTSEVPKFLGIPDAPPSPTRSVDTTDSYNYYLTSKPKVKLAARPAADGAIRPQASGNFRPVSSLPAGYRFGKGQKKGKGKDGDSASLIHEEIPEMEPPADTTPAAAPEDSLGITGDASRPTTSTGPAADTLSVHTLSVPAAPTKPTITPEKARLMKAMKLREKKKKQQEQQKQKQKTPGPEDENTSTITEGTESAVDIPGPEDKNTITDLEYPVDAAIESHDNDDDDGPDGEEANAREDEEQQGAEDGTTASISQADSGVVLDSLSSSVQIDEVPEGTLTSSVQIDQLSEGTTLTSSVQVDQVSEGTRSESPAVTSSERDEETAASSLSDSTDETVHAAKNPDEVDAVTSGDEEAQKTAPSGASEDEGRVAEENASGSLLPAAVITAAADSSSSSSSAADASSSLKEDESTATIQTRETEIETETETETGGSSAAAMESNEEIAAGAANKGSAKAETEKEKKGIAVPISKLSANIPTSGAPPAASLSGMGSGAGEIPPVLAHAPAGPGPGPGATPGDVAQATETEDKGELEAEVASPPSSIPVPILLDSQTTAAMEEQADLHLVQQTSPSDEAIPTSTPSDTAAPDEPEPQSRSKRAAGNLTPIRTDLIHGDDNDDAAALLVQEKTQTQATQDEDDALNDTDTDTDTDNKPMVATKSPLTPVFPSAPIANGPLGARAPQTQAHTVRTVSNPVRGNFIAPTDVTQSTARSLSSGAAFLHKVTQQQSASLATMKPNVGSSISQRIKALEKLSATSGDQSRPVSRERPSSTFFAVQKRDTSRPPSVVDRTKSLKGRAASPTPSHQDDALFEGRVRLQRSGSVVSRVSMFEPLASASSPPSGLAPGTQSRGRPESVAITTKIIRDPSLQQSLSGYELPRDASDYGYQSPTDHHHHRGIDDGSSERRSRSRERGGEDDMGRRSSLNAVKGFFKDPRKTVTVSTNMRHAIVSRTTTQSPSTASHRLSMSSRRSITFDRDISSVTEDSFSGDDKSSEKKTSRAGRFMRKLSSFSSGIKSSKTNKAPSADESRNNASVNRQQQQQQPSAAPPAATSAGEASIVSDLGDVNVQFPDSLLWKRRNLVLDSAGNIILSALPAQSSRTAVGTKTYHMSKFRQPEVPDVDAQELPNSVVLNFLDGMGIQLACEDRTGQMNVLHVLQAAHANHSR